MNRPVALGWVSLVMFRPLYVGEGPCSSESFEIILRVPVATSGGEMGMGLLAHRAHRL